MTTSTRRTFLLESSAILLAWAGLAVCGYLAYRHAFPHVEHGFCGAGSGCAKVLASKYEKFAGIPLPWLGLAFYAALLAGLFASALRAPRPGWAAILRVTDVLALAGTVVSGLLLYVQFGVIKAFCVLCTASALLACGCFVVIGRIPRVLPDPAVAGSRKRPLALGAALALASLLVAGIIVVQHDRGVVARMGDDVITQEEMNRELRLTLYEQEKAQYQARRLWIGRKFSNLVLAREAARRGLTVDELLALEVDAAVSVTDQEVDEYIKAHAEYHSEEERRKRVRDNLLAKKRQERKLAYLEKLLPAKIEVYLRQPEKPPRFKIDTSAAHMDGPAKAAVVLLVFSDFECPFCAQISATLRKFREAFPDQVAIGFFHFPLDAHPLAEPAAVAAECAAAQGRFWSYHDAVFAKRGKFALDDLTDLAQKEGLDMAKFRECRAGRAPRDAVRAAMKEGESLGITATPALFLNGRYLGGNILYDDLLPLVREEIRTGGRGGD